jgi:predicted Zn-dependent protease
VNRLLAPLLCVIAIALGWVAYTQVASRPAGVSAPLVPKVAGSKIYFIPVGDFPVEQLEPLVHFYRQKYNLDIAILQSVPIDPTTRDKSRHQLMAEKLADSVRAAVPEYANDPKAILIGFTSEDMYQVSQNWEFAFGWRWSTVGVAVVSTARLNLTYVGQPSDPNFPATRLRKIVTKDVGILYYGLPQSSNRRSVLYSQIMGMAGLDDVGEDF